MRSIKSKRKKACSVHMDNTNYCMVGFELKQADANKLEQDLKRDPSNLSCRLKLLGYYFRGHYSIKSKEKKRLQIVLWMIEEIPENNILGDPWALIDKEDNPDGYQKCKKLWSKQLTKYKKNVSIITNAASFLRVDGQLAERLYKQAIILEPQNPDWSRNLAWHLRRGAPKNSTRMKKAFVAMQDAVRKTKEPAFKRYYYDDLAEIAYDISEWSLAYKFAKKSVLYAKKFGTDWDTGNAIHNGNCVLGRLALSKGNIKTALIHLKNAGKTPGSPQLNSFGPNMRFAQEMLHAKQRDAVIKYLQDCKRFWSGESKVLSDCIDQIEWGKSPRLPRVI